MQSTSPIPLKKIKLHFLLKKQLPYGTSIYVVGNIPILGTWHIKNSLRLNWNKDDYWSGFTEIEIFTYRVMYVYFKYVIANYQNPNDQDVIWEDGDFNRMIVIDGDDDNIVVENLWNMNRISINLLVPKYQVDEDTEIYLAGGCNELGNWRNKLKMQKTTLTTLSQKQLQIAKQNLILQDYHLYSVLLNIQRNLSYFTYYFLKKHHQTWLTDRIPTHQLSISKCQNKHPTCLNISISTISSNYQLLQLSKFIQLYYNKILDNVYIGTSIQTCDDVKELKKKCITDIVYVAGSESSYCQRGPKNLVKMISQENKIQYWVVKVDVKRGGEKVMDEVRDGLELLNMLLDPQQQSQSQKQQPTQQQQQKQQQLTDIKPPSPYPSCSTPTLPQPPKILYIYCSTGTLLSPLLVSLYLHVYKNYPLKKSLEYVKEKHPIAGIDENIMSMASNFGRERFFGVERANFMGRGENEEREREENRRKAIQRAEIQNQREREDRRNETMGIQNIRSEPIQLIGKMKMKDKE